MRQRADWMTMADDEILEYLRDEGAGTPKRIADDLGMNNDYIGRRCRKLAQAGLLDRPARGLYVISDSGREYLQEDFDASDISEPS